METATNSSTVPEHFECIVCQMTTASLSRLHRHQTYQHTSEELSLSTIGLHSSLIKSCRLVNSIAYDNSWLCDPAKQAEFYTTSARLLNDCDDGVEHCGPVDYAIGREEIFFESEVKEEIQLSVAAQLGDCAAGDVGRCSPGDYVVVGFDGCRAVEISTSDRDTNLQGNFDVSGKHSVGCLENETKAEESDFGGVDAEQSTKLFGEGREVEEPETRDTMGDSFVNCVEGLCNDLGKIVRKRTRSEKSPFRIPAAKKARVRGKARGNRRKKAKISDSAYHAKTDLVTEIPESKEFATVNSVQHIAEIPSIVSPVKQDLANENIVAVRSEVEAESGENFANGIFADFYLETLGSEVTVIQDSGDANFAEIKSQVSEREISSEMNFANEDCRENSPEGKEVSDTTKEITFPWYPPDINEHSVLVLDPATQQLVWRSVAIVDEETSREPQILPELTNADLRDSEICESITISSDSRVNEGSGNSSPQSQNPTEERRKPRKNFVLRPRKVTGKSRRRGKKAK